MENSKAICISLTLAIVLSLIPSGYGNEESDALLHLPKTYSNEESDALLYLPKNLGPHNNAFENWDQSLSQYCTWYHIICNEAKKVIRIDLNNRGLRGSLPQALSKLKSLEYLNLYNNHIYGWIPSAYGDIPSLQSMNFANNKLSGPIPRNFSKLKNLIFLRFENNNVCGYLPPGLEHIVVGKNGNPRFERPC